MFQCHISPRFLPERSDRRQLSSSSPRQLVDQVVCLCLGDVISEGQSSLQEQRCVVSMDQCEYGLEHYLFKRSLINLLNLQSNASRKGMALVPIFISMMTQMVDRPNTTPQYLSRQKTLTFKVLLFLFRQDHGFDPPCGSHQLPVFLNLKKRCSLRSSATRTYLRVKDILCAQTSCGVYHRDGSKMSSQLYWQQQLANGVVMCFSILI